MDGNKQRVYQISSANQFIISFTYIYLSSLPWKWLIYF